MCVFAPQTDDGKTCMDVCFWLATHMGDLGKCEVALAMFHDTYPKSFPPVTPTRESVNRDTYVAYLKENEEYNARADQ